MKTEALIFRNVTADNAPSSNLENVSLTVYQGEILGFYGIGRRRKNLLFDLISGQQSPSQGVIYWCYDPATAENGRPRPGSPDVATLSYKNSQLFDDMTVWDNLIIFQSAGNRKMFLRPKGVGAQILQYLQEYLPDVAPDTYVYKLTRVQRFILEILKARLANSKILVLDDTSFKYDSAEHMILKKLLTETVENGAAFMLLSHNMNTLLNLSNRIVFFHRETLLRCIENTPENALKIQGILPSSIPIFSPQMSAYGPAHDATFRLDNIMVGKTPISITLQSRKITVLYDPQRQSLRAIVRSVTAPNSGCQISWNGAQPKDIHAAIRDGEFSYLRFIEQDNCFSSNLLVETMSVTNNICFSLFKQISTASIVHRKSVHFLLNEFRKWSGMDDLSPYLYCSELSFQAKILLSFFKLHLTRPSVILCKCPSSISDSDFLLINQILEDFALNHNCAVVFLVPEIAAFPPIADLFYATGAGKDFHQTSRAELCDPVLVPPDKRSVAEHE